MRPKSDSRKTIRRVDKTKSFVIFSKSFVVFSKCCLRGPLDACRRAPNYIKAPEQSCICRKSAPVSCKDNTFFAEIQIIGFRVNISLDARCGRTVSEQVRGRNPRLELSLDKIGVGSEEQNRKTSFHILFFSRFALPLDKIGCGSEEQRQILRLCLCSSLTLHYLCTSLADGLHEDEIPWTERKIRSPGREHRTPSANSASKKGNAGSHVKTTTKQNAQTHSPHT